MNSDFNTKIYKNYYFSYVNDLNKRVNIINS